ncbi:MAG: hypothetical protein HGA61_00500 [Candidatus Moranbacteria bacterium]|nr:hypothetical protein [Candidatus Moranbacteria bacterium]
MVKKRGSVFTLPYLAGVVLISSAIFCIFEEMQTVKADLISAVMLVSYSLILFLLLFYWEQFEKIFSKGENGIFFYLIFLPGPLFFMVNLLFLLFDGEKIIKILILIIFFGLFISSVGIIFLRRTAINEKTIDCY